MGELLDRIDSHEISEWMAFERAFGPLGDEWSNEALAAIYDQLQILCAVMGSDADRVPLRRASEWSLDPEEDAAPLDDEDDEE